MSILLEILHFIVICLNGIVKHMTIAHWLAQAISDLTQANVDAPRTDALVLLESTLQKDRAWVLSHSDDTLTEENIKTLKDLLQQRIAHIPLAYITHQAWFYGRQFYVDEHVLVPRPESEDIITLVKKHAPDRIIDVGTGSGCLAITCKLELPNTTVYAVDISNDALVVARKNADHHNTQITFLKSDLLQKVTKVVTSKTLLAVNLPYVPDGLITSPEITTEPELALFSGQDGMRHYTTFWQQISELRTKPQTILTESLTNQHVTMTTLAKTAGYTLSSTERLIEEFTVQ
jgi:release factor glutamine methyltransferase